MAVFDELHGDVDEGYGRVADVFADNFSRRGEVGAAVALYVGSRPVVDLWGGVADRRNGLAWGADTPAVVFSCTKGIVAICAYLLVQQGRLDLDSPATRYWPEFGNQGKEGIPVRWLLAHRAGLPALDRTLTLDEVLAWRPVVEAIEAQAPLWVPGTAHSYHPMTYGWLVGEIVRRITGATPGKFFQDAVAGPLGLRTWIGVPAAELDSVAWTQAPPAEEGEAAVDPVAERAATMGGAYPFPAHPNGLVSFNDRRIQAGEIPAAGGVSTARDLARLYAACVSGARLLTPASVSDAVTVRSWGKQVYKPADDGRRWGTGFMIDSPPARPMLGERSFGHDGAGGLLAFGDDEYQVGFGYVANQMGGADDERANQLTAAVRASLDG